MNLVIFDIETTGFSPYYHEITQIAAVRMRAGKVMRDETFSTFVKTTKPIPWHITKITGVTNALVRSAPPPDVALQAFARFAGHDSMLVAHNGKKFDARFLSETCVRHNMQGREIPCIDTLDLSRTLWPGGSHTLDALISRLKISPLTGLHRHDARCDVHLLADCMEKMLGRLKCGLEDFLTHQTLLPAIADSIH